MVEPALDLRPVPVPGRAVLGRAVLERRPYRGWEFEVVYPFWYDVEAVL
jgi:hypothetical protein